MTDSLTGLVMVVDADAARRGAGIRALRDAGFTTSEVADGDGAVRQAAAAEPAVILVAARLPDMDGAELLSRLRERHPRLALAQIVEGEPARPSPHADAVCFAPNPPEAIVAAVRTALRLRRAEAAWQRAETFKDNFLSALGHELRSALSPLHMSLHLLKTAGLEAERGQRAVASMERQIGDIVKLVDDLMDLVRAETGRLRIEPAATTLDAVLERALGKSRGLIERAGHRLELDVPQTGVALEADAARLAQALSCLLANSARYMGEGGRVALTARAGEDELRLSVADEGFGLDAATLPLLFQAFAPGRHQRQGGGLGIGLPLARALVELHGGTIEAESEGPGRGSRFTLRVPRRAARR